MDQRQHKTRYIEEKVGKSLKHIGTGDSLLNSIIAQVLRPTMGPYETERVLKVNRTRQQPTE